MAEVKGRPDFIELAVGDIAAARAFYEGVFGWTMNAFGPTYACTLTGDVDVGLQADPPEKSAAPLVVIQVPDLEAAYDSVVAAGGAITREILAFPGGRRFQFRDPAGNELAAHKPDANG
jgi:predicted enzyme related to lactoylglutathione lyase